ncbi:MAG: hypothetical protein LBF27_12355 [Sphingobacterium sp.]|jgi:hypothetical protein|nr:hypothetical protein [Sphingobacterium sp.]
MGNSNSTKPAFKERLQLAVSGIMQGYLLLEEAVDKYDVPPSSIIKALKKILKLKKAALTAPNQYKLSQ